jgi:hypothetical protein
MLNLSLLNDRGTRSQDGTVEVLRCGESGFEFFDAAVR